MPVLTGVTAASAFVANALTLWFSGIICRAF